MKVIETVIYREGKYWVAQALNVDVSSFGSTPDEAISSVREALQLYFEDEPEVEIRDVAEARIEEIRV